MSRLVLKLARKPIAYAAALALILSSCVQNKPVGVEFDRNALASSYWANSEQRKEVLHGDFYWDFDPASLTVAGISEDDARASADFDVIQKIHKRFSFSLSDGLVIDSEPIGLPPSGLSARREKRIVDGFDTQLRNIYEIWAMSATISSRVKDDQSLKEYTDENGKYLEEPTKGGFEQYRFSSNRELIYYNALTAFRRVEGRTVTKYEDFGKGLLPVQILVFDNHGTQINEYVFEYPKSIMLVFPHRLSYEYRPAKGKKLKWSFYVKDSEISAP